MTIALIFLVTLINRVIANGEYTWVENFPGFLTKFSLRHAAIFNFLKYFHSYTFIIIFSSHNRFQWLSGTLLCFDQQLLTLILFFLFYFYTQLQDGAYVGRHYAWKSKIIRQNATAEERWTSNNCFLSRHRHGIGFDWWDFNGKSLGWKIGGLWGWKENNLISSIKWIDPW